MQTSVVFASLGLASQLLHSLGFIRALCPGDDTYSSAGLIPGTLNGGSPFPSSSINLNLVFFSVPTLSSAVSLQTVARLRTAAAATVEDAGGLALTAF